MPDKNPITKEGYDLLSAEIILIRKLLSENNKDELKSKYCSKDKAKERLAIIEKATADPSIIATVSGETYRVQFGCRVLLGNFETGEEFEVRIVSPIEAGLDKGYMSVDSVIGKALLGKSIGDVVKINEGNKMKEFEILEIYP